MRHQVTLMLATGVLAYTFSCAAQAETTEVTERTIRTSTVSSDGSGVSSVSTSFSLPRAGNYLVVDPTTGILKGRYDPVAGLVDGRQIQSGLAIVDGPSGRVMAIADATGRIVDVTVAPASDTMLMAIEARRKEMDRSLAEALSAGRLPSAQVVSLRSELERIANEEALLRSAGNVVPYSKALMFSNDLSLLSQRIYPVGAVTAVETPQFVVMDKQVTMVDSVTYRKLQLTRRIDAEYQSGRLSQDNVSRLKSQLDKVSSLETKYRQSGELSSSKSRTLAMKLDQVESELGNDIAEINEKRARIGIKVN
ncbi:MAG: hypothetical protein HY986_14065 [Candidatus Melainabacteria bacterium]|nr:hypothetical protein [Candidatus Melainabacteria bacterium]